MQNNDFEKQVRQKMEELKVAPDDAVWEKVAASLPEEKKRRWLVWFFLLAVIFAGLLIYRNIYQQNKNGSQVAIMKNAEAATDSTIKQSSKKITDSNLNAIKKQITASLITKSQSVKVQSTSSTDTNFKSLKLVLKNTAIIKLTNTVALSGNTNANILFSKKILRSKRNAKTKVNIKQADVYDGQDELSNPNITGLKENGEQKINITIPTDSIAIATTFSNDSNKVLKKTETAKTKITIETDTSKKTAAKRVKKNNPWKLSALIAAGVTNTKQGIFKSESYVSSVFASNPSTPITVNNRSSLPKAGVSFKIGLSVEKKLSRQITFLTGLNYAYFSTNLKTGERRDTLSNIGMPTNRSTIEYSNGSFQKYINQFHYLELPMILQLSISKKAPGYIEAGPTLGYLLHSNKLIYSNYANLYFTQNNIFNRFMISANVGAGILLAKRSKYPFSIGYRFNYGINSVVKSSLTNQHLSGSLLYARFSLKK